MWGGTTAPFVGDVGPYDVLDDGALYDVASDTWHALPPGPAGRTHASLQWSDGRLLLGGGLGTADQRGDYLADVWAYDPGTDAWEELPSAPEGGLAGGAGTGYVAGETSAVTAESQGRARAGHSPGGCWAPTDGSRPRPDGVLRMGDLTVATSMGIGNPGDDPFGVQIRGGRDQWLDAATAPFANRMGGTVVGTADHLVIVGGMQGAGLELAGDAWVFDLVASTADGADRAPATAHAPRRHRSGARGRGLSAGRPGPSGRG